MLLGCRLRRADNDCARNWDRSWEGRELCNGKLYHTISLAALAESPCVCTSSAPNARSGVRCAAYDHGDTLLMGFFQGFVAV